ncbi:hypothetical protein BDZ91DRAFT_182648 [Kalaharituber pfeilii]|nr:hypothetical protein BDZ91DRAFT_182648 [Kalaharituber pfeilii]
MIPAEPQASSPPEQYSHAEGVHDKYPIDLWRVVAWFRGGKDAVVQLLAGVEMSSHHQRLIFFFFFFFFFISLLACRIRD